MVQPVNIEINPTAALPLVMTINELCTNAVKYGALKTSEGRIEISAKIDEDEGRLRLRWKEKGGPPVETPTRRSFGMQLIEKSFMSQLSGNALVSFNPMGVVCEFDIPLAAIQMNMSV